MLGLNQGDSGLSLIGDMLRVKGEGYFYIHYGGGVNEGTGRVTFK